MAIEVFNRYEHKYRLNKEQFDEIVKVLDEHMTPDKYNKDHKPYTIANVYYDTEDNELIRRSLAKPEYKEKLRLRSYGVPGHEDKVFLEIKKKIGGIVTKRRVSMTLADSDAYFADRTKPAFDKYITEQVFRELDVFLDNYPIAPKQYISYQREAFFGKHDHDFRLTFDRKITERRYDLGLNYESYGNYIIGADQRLMEVKVSNAIPDWLVGKMSELGIFKTSFSKYGRAYQNFVKTQIEGAQQTTGRRIYISGISMVNNNVIMNRSV